MGIACVGDSPGVPPGRGLPREANARWLGGWRDTADCNRATRISGRMLGGIAEMGIGPGTVSDGW